MGFPIVPKGEGGNDKRERADSQTHDSPIGRRLLQFLHMSETETVVMTEESMMVGMTVMA
jgi:hypothetical protein